MMLDAGQGNGEWLIILDLPKKTAELHRLYSASRL